MARGCQIYNTPCMDINPNKVDTSKDHYVVFDLKNMKPVRLLSHYTEFQELPESNPGSNCDVFDVPGGKKMVSFVVSSTGWYAEYEDL